MKRQLVGKKRVRKPARTWHVSEELKKVGVLLRTKRVNI